MKMKVHHHPVRVYYEDTDAGGVVYHASYIRFAERARTEFLRDLGHDQTRLREKEGIVFAVVSLTADYKAPARLDDLLTVKTAVAKVGRASMEMKQEICKGDKAITELKVTLVCIDQEFKAVRLPEAIRKIFEGRL
jgi:acyl-CoA thioester hydrolase